MKINKEYDIFIFLHFYEFTLKIVANLIVKCLYTYFKTIDKYYLIQFSVVYILYIRIKNKIKNQYIRNVMN